MSSLVTHHYQHDSITSACQMSSLYLKCPDIIVMVLHIASCILYLQHSTPQPPGFVFGGWCHQTAKQRIDPSQAQWHRTVAVGVPTQAQWPWRVPRFDPPGLVYSISASLPFNIPVVPGQAGGGSFPKEKNYIAKKEFAYRMCARRPTSAMPKSFLCLCSPSAVPWW